MVGYNPLFLLDKLNDLTLESIFAIIGLKNMVWKIKHLDSIQLNINCLQFDQLVNKVSHIIFNREEEKDGQ